MSCENIDLQEQLITVHGVLMKLLPESLNIVVAGPIFRPSRGIFARTLYKNHCSEARASATATLGHVSANPDTIMA